MASEESGKHYLICIRRKGGETESFDGACTPTIESGRRRVGQQHEKGEGNVGISKIKSPPKSKADGVPRGAIDSTV